jgi:hypothetical protein
MDQDPIGNEVSFLQSLLLKIQETIPEHTQSHYCRQRHELL